MRAYRIKKTEHCGSEWFTLQTRLFGFLWWYNPDNIDGAITGQYDTLAQAEEAHKMKVTPCSVSFIEPKSS